MATLDNPPSLSMLTTTPQLKPRRSSVPEGLWKRYIRPLIVVRPHGVTTSRLADLFFEAYGYRLDFRMYGFKSFKELVLNIEDLVIFGDIVSFDWFNWPPELP